MEVVTGSHYLAFVLDDDCHQKVKRLYRKRHEVVVCHHVTIQLNIMEENIASLQALVDSNPRLELNCLVESDTIDFFRVLVNGKMIETDQSFTHLTFTRKSDARNRDSNRVLKGELKHSGILSAGGVLTGKFELVPYKE